MFVFEQFRENDPYPTEYLPCYLIDVPSISVATTSTNTEEGENHNNSSRLKAGN